MSTKRQRNRMRVRIEPEFIVNSLLIAIWTGICCWRGTTQSITVDEAFTFNRFLDGPWSSIYSSYDPNNHVLFTILTKCSLKLFGVNSFVLRSISIASGLILLIVIHQVIRALIQSQALRIITFALCCLYPLLMDFCVAARGYSLSLALLFGGLLAVIRARFLLGGILLGLAISANLASVVGVVSIALAYTVAGELSLRRRLWFIGVSVLVAAAVTLLVYCPLLREMKASRFQSGYDSLYASILSLIRTSLYAADRHHGIFATEQIPELICKVGIPALLVFGLVTAWTRAPVVDRRQLLPLLTIVAILVLLLAAHSLMGLMYPPDRAFLYLVVLLILTWGIACDGASDAARNINFPMMLLVAIQFFTQFHVSFFQFWPAERRLGTIASVINADSLTQERADRVVCTSWLHEQTLEFYRRTIPMRRVKAIVPLGSDPAGADYYVLSGADTGLVKERGLTTLFVDADGGVVLAHR